jgi:SecD/SecF fusion protein
MTRGRSHHIPRASIGLLGLVLVVLTLSAGCGLLPAASGRKVRIVLEAAPPKGATQVASSDMDRCAQIIQKRLKEMGARGTSVSRQSTDQIVVEVRVRRGMSPDRVTQIVGKTAKLEFKLVKHVGEARVVLERLNGALAQLAGTTENSSTEEAASTTGPLLDLLDMDNLDRFGGAQVLEEDYPAVERLLSGVNVDSILPRDASIAFSASEELLNSMRPGRILYVLNRDAEMSGNAIDRAVVKMGLDSRNPNAAGISVTMTSDGANLFRRITGANIGRQLAIVMDGDVLVAPVIRDRIPTGQAQITGNITTEEASDLAIAMRSGAMPVPLRVIEVREVEKGASKAQ